MADDAAARIVLDTNSLVSGFLFPQSIPGQVLDLVVSRFLLLMFFLAEIGLPIIEEYIVVIC